jgi:hypothetical protein
MAALLLSLGADLDAKDVDGTTPRDRTPSICCVVLFCWLIEMIGCLCCYD